MMEDFQASFPHIPSLPSTSSPAFTMNQGNAPAAPAPAPAPAAAAGGLWQFTPNGFVQGGAHQPQAGMATPPGTQTPPGDPPAPGQPGPVGANEDDEAPHPPPQQLQQLLGIAHVGQCVIFRPLCCIY